MLKKTSRIILYTFVLISTFCLCHEDAYDSIVPWALDFIRLIKQGRVFEFYTFTQGTGGVYNLMIISIVALWILPFHLMNKILNISINIVYYVVWYKLLLVCALIISCMLFKKVLIKLRFTEEKSDLGVLMFAASPMVLIGNIGMGQIDIVGTVFIILAIYFILCKKNVLAFVMMSIAASLKYFAIIIAIPYILLKEKNIYKIIRNIIICVIVPISVEIISGIDTYYGKTKINMANRVIEVSFNFVSLFLISFFCLLIFSYYTKIDNNNRWNEVALPTSAFILFLMFIMIHPQWVVYGLPLIIIMILSLKNEALAVLLYLAASLGYLLYTICVWSTSVTNYMVNKSLLRFLTGVSYDGPYLQELTHIWNGELGKSTMMACVVMILVLFIYENVMTNSTEAAQYNTGVEKIKQELTLVPSGLFLISTLLLYFVYM